MDNQGKTSKIGQQLRIMLWKVLIVRRASWIALLLQFILPLASPFLLSRILATRDGDVVNATLVPTTTFAKPDLTFGDTSRVPQIILYAPAGNFADSIMQHVRQTLEGRTVKTEIQSFPSEDALYRRYVNLSQTFMASLTAGIIFEQDVTNGFTYTIRTEMPKFSNSPFESKFNKGPLIDLPYNGFAQLQSLVNLAFLEQSFPQWKSGKEQSISDLSINWHRFPHPSYIKPGINKRIELAPVAVHAGFNIIYAIIIKRLSTEKSSQIREMYRITGLIDWIYWFVHFIDAYAVFLVQALIITSFYCFGVGGNGQKIFTLTSPWFIYLILVIWGFNFITSALAISIPFNRPVFALTIGIVYWGLQTTPDYFINPISNPLLDPCSTNTARLVSCLLPNMAFTFAFNIVAQKEIYGSAAGWNNLFEPVPVYDQLTLGYVLICLIGTSIVHILLIYYLSNVFPSQYRIQKPWLFPIYALFRFKGAENSVNEQFKESTNEYVEPLEPTDQVKVSIRNITKKFGANSLIAVDNVSLDVPHKQVTMLLGENGAGKTTLMSMIIGLIPPSQGTAIVDGHDIIRETAEARKSLSFCPQSNILQPDLTVEQHLILYGSIKGVPSEDLESVVEKILKMIRFSQSKEQKPSELSGGMCRRLNLGIALIGGSEVIILDEPTSGLDPESRRAVWDILNEIKTERTIIMTTHFIEEADAIGDRIAIMRKGTLACFGSPMFLKKIFGTGYELRIARSEESNLDDINAVTKSFFPEAEMGYAAGAEAIFALPQVSDSSIFFQFFQELEAKKSDLNISSWGLSYTTLEDVFIRVIQSSEMKRNSSSDLKVEIAHGSANVNPGQIETGKASLSTGKVNTGFELILERMKALIVKRIQYATRYWRVLLFQIITPVLMFALIMFLDRTIDKQSSLPDLRVNLSLLEIYGHTKGPFNNSGDGEIGQFGDIFRSVMTNEQIQIEPLNSETVDDYMLEKASSLSFHDYTHQYLLGSEWTNLGPKIYFNGQATHSLPIAVNSFFEAFYQFLSGSSSKLPKFNVKNHPFLLKEDISRPLILAVVRPKIWTIFLQLTLPFLAASFIMIPVHERSSRAKLLQIMTGLHPILYWLGHFIFDIFIHIICTILIYGAVFLYNPQDIFNQKYMHVAFILPIIVVGLASIPLAYIFSFVFERPALGYSFLLIFYVISGVITSNVSILLNQLYPEYENLFNRLVGLIPLSTMSQEIGRILAISLEAEACELIDPQILEAECFEGMGGTTLIVRCCPNLCNETNDCFSYKNPLSWQDGILKGLLELFGVACFNFILLISLEYYSNRFEWIIDFKRRLMDILCCCWTNELKKETNPIDGEEIDSDVLAEQARIKNSIHSTDTQLSSIDVERNLTSNGRQLRDILIVEQLAKKYGDHWAVRGLSFGVHQNECFGLLGVNGAGKSTTFKMLVGDIRPTHGNACIDHYSLVETKRKFQECIGYCPQYDALINRLTAREMLYLFARLRGMDEKDIPTTVDQLIVDVDLERHADKMTSYYSGGNKRKLSLALALIASPRVIFLDEPSSGVDAGNRRRMWSILSAFREKGCSLVLTTHSMEECETLSSRIAIMVNGKFRCLGSLQHLRQKFGQGYSLYIKINSDKASDRNYVDNLKSNVEAQLGAELKQHHFVNLFYHIKEKSLPWSKLFQIMEEIKLNHQLEDYVISDTSLEQIFMDFARKQMSSD